jgi:polysaccharide biosynthesis protein PslG
MRAPPPRCLWLLLVLALMGLAAAPTTSTALAAPPGPPAEEFFGANTQSLITSFPEESWPQYLGVMAGMGLRAARSDAPWGSAEPNAPVNGVHSYDWRRLDAIVSALAAADMRWLPVIANLLPSWTAKNGERFHPDFYDDYAAYVAALARRYGSAGTFWVAHPGLPYRPVLQYSVWNEPNSTHFWRPQPDAREYMRLYEPTRAALAAADPGAQALFALGWQDFEGYVRSALEDGASPATLDGIGFAPYGLTAAATLDLVRRLRLTLRSLGRPGVPIYVVEWGLPSSRLGDATQPSDATRAATLALIGEAVARSDCNVGNFLVYSLVEPETDPTNYEETMGTLDRTGALTITGGAYRDAVDRYKATPQPTGLPVCAEPSPPRASPRLPLGLTLEVSSASCYRAEVGYRGYPLEDASVHFSSGQAGGTRQTDREGAADFCFPGEDEPSGTTWAEVPGAAASTVVKFGPQEEAGGDVPGAAVSPIVEPPAAGDTTPRAARDRIPPVIRRFSLQRRRVRVDPRRRPGTARPSQRGGSFFRYVLSEDATVQIRIRRVGRRPRPVCPRTRRRTCNHVRLSGTISRKSRAGRNRTKFSGWIGRNVLRPGRYRAVITGTDAAGNRSTRRAVRFWVRWR